MSSAAIFIDKDGTLVEDVPYNVDPALIRLTPGAAVGLHELQQQGFRLIVVSNQSGVARGRFTLEALAAVEGRIRQLLREHGVDIDAFYWCPHLPGAPGPLGIDCECRKPKPGLIQQAAREQDVDLARSWLVGDILDDIEAGRRAGVRTILVTTGGETEWRVTPDRVPDQVASGLAEAARVIVAAREGAAAARPRATLLQSRPEGERGA